MPCSIASAARCVGHEVPLAGRRRRGPSDDVPVPTSGRGGQAWSASSQSVTKPHACAAVSGAAVTRGWVMICWKAISDAHGRPTRSSPLSASSSQIRAVVRKWDCSSTA